MTLSEVLHPEYLISCCTHSGESNLVMLCGQWPGQPATTGQIQRMNGIAQMPPAQQQPQPQRQQQAGKSLSDPDVPVGNNGWDNVNSDLIVHVDDVLHGADGSQCVSSPLVHASYMLAEGWRLQRIVIIILQQATAATGAATRLRPTERCATFCQRPMTLLGPNTLAGIVSVLAFEISEFTAKSHRSLTRMVISVEYGQL